MESSIVNRELSRQRLYKQNIIEWLCRELPQLKYIEVCHLVLRYIFNKNITRKQTDDPVFIVTRSPLAESQLRKDFNYSKIKLDSDKIINELEKRISRCANYMVVSTHFKDGNISVENGSIYYNKKVYSDISGLATKFPTFANYALALNIRYSYLHLLNHGLARQFEIMGFKPQESTEGFASAFNHYFDRFCSAFPDLEKPFGSMGSFFDTTNWETDVVYVNPPFDETLMNTAMERIYKYLQEDNTHRKFIFTLPNWDNWPELEALKTSQWTTSLTIYKKGELPFIDYMNNKKIIYPCDIAEIVLEKQEEIEIVFEEEE